MKEPVKFLFDTRFETGAPAPRPPRSNFTAAELDAARKAGEKAGHAAGRSQALSEIEARAASAIGAVAAGMSDTLAAISTRHEAQTREALAVAIEAVRKLFPALAQRNEIAEIEALLAECVAQLPTEPRLLLRVPEALADLIRPGFDAAVARTGFGGQVALVGDPALPDGRSRIEWSDGGVVRDAAAIWAEINSIVARYAATDTGVS